MGASQGYSDAVVAELLREYRATGDSHLRDRVVEQMTPLVRSVAVKFAGREPVEDLESEGYVGLIRAVDRFSPERGNRFSTFAMHLIAGQMRHYLRDRGHLIRQPAWLQELNGKVSRITAELEQRLQRPPTVAEIAAEANISEEGVDELAAARQAAHVCRLDASADGDDDDYLDVDPEKFYSRDYHTFELPVEDRIVLEAAMERLKDLERKVLVYFFYQDCNQSEIARRLGISCNYAGYVLRNGLKHLKSRLPIEHPLDRRQGGPGLPASVVDAATGIYTAEHFDQRLVEEISRAQRYDRPVSVCCIRIPAACSPEMLEAAAQALRDAIRRVDVLGRTGSREFGIIFPNTGVVSVDVTTRLALRLHPVVRAPVHAGAVTFPEAGRSSREVYEAARQAAMASDLPDESRRSPAPELFKARPVSR